MSENGKAVDTAADSTDGMELAKVIVDHWRMGAEALLTIDDVVNASEAVGVSSDLFIDLIKAVDAYRGYEFGKSSMSHAFVPQENVETVHKLLDEIINLCVEI